MIAVDEMCGTINPTDVVPCERQCCCQWLQDALRGLPDCPHAQQCGNDAANEYAFCPPEAGPAIFDLCADCGKAVVRALRNADAIANTQQDGDTIGVRLAE